MIEAMGTSINGGVGVGRVSGGVGDGYTPMHQHCGAGGGGENAGEEELSVLPRHTKVVVTGNNRTKSVLVGLQGVVKKAVGLGGWHWLKGLSFFTGVDSSSYCFCICNAAIEFVFCAFANPYPRRTNAFGNSFPVFHKLLGCFPHLICCLFEYCTSSDKLNGSTSSFNQHKVFQVLTNGIEVKLQRNALSVIEAPTGNEEDDDFDSENGNWNGFDLAFDDNERSHRQKHRSPKWPGSSHRATSGSICHDSSSNPPVSAAIGSMKVDLSKLEMDALWRYSRHFNLVSPLIIHLVQFQNRFLRFTALSPRLLLVEHCDSLDFYQVDTTIPNLSREQLVNVVQRHFMSQQLDEQQVIAVFIQSAKRLKAVCK
ncbi:hypothetical protein AKJ16_DCAP08249 [Drosera capensis]